MFYKFGKNENGAGAHLGRIQNSLEILDWALNSLWA
jgi:hypothetical protein